MAQRTHQHLAVARSVRQQAHIGLRQFVPCAQGHLVARHEQGWHRSHQGHGGHHTQHHTRQALQHTMAPPQHTGPTALRGCVFHIARPGARLYGGPHALRWLLHRHRIGQHPQPPFPLRHQQLHVAAIAQQPLEAAARATTQRAQHVGRRQVVQQRGVGVPHAPTPCAARQLFRRSRPRRIQALTEPRGAPICAATSECDRPW
ncbi:hypothetical protein D3C71_1086590 [compost metagenome]